MPNDNELWTVNETAKYLRCSPQTVRRLVKDKMIGYIRRGNQVLLFPREAVDRYLRERTFRTI